jgi:DNA polymerase-3 subunit epsilon
MTSGLFACRAATSTMQLPPLYILDFEGSRRTGVLEYGVVRLDAGRISAAHTRMCRPLAAPDAREVAVHGLAEAALAGLPPFADDYQRFVAWRRAGVFAAHNRAVEQNLLRDAWPLPPWVPDWSRPGASCADWGPWLDTLPICRASRPDLADYGLGALVVAFGLQAALSDLADRYCPPARRRPHCALYDALAAALLLQRLFAAEPAAGLQAWLLRSGEGEAQGMLPL